MAKEITVALSKDELNAVCSFMENHIDVLDSGDKQFDKQVHDGLEKMLLVNRMIKPVGKRAKKHLDDCEIVECKYCMENSCCFGLRCTGGCYMDLGDDALDDLVNRKMMFRAMENNVLVNGGNEDEIKLIKQIGNKSFNFIFKGHEYTYRDSARDQSRCPHCGNQTADGRCWKEKSAEYIGTTTDIFVCFECPKCFEKFFYHGVD